MLAFLFGARQCDASWNISAGVRVDGNDIRGVQNVSDAAECCVECHGESNCRAYVFVRSRSLCWLKTSSAGAHRPDADCVWGSDPSAPTPPPSPVPCNRMAGNVGCNMAGVCNRASGLCACDHGWTGASCERLNFGLSYTCADGGLCLHGELNSVATWGGQAVHDPVGGKWHVFAAMFPSNKTLDSWLTNSVVVHAVAAEPQGPYTASDVALGPRGAATDAFFDSITEHNPAAHRDPVTGTWLLFYMGSKQTPKSMSGSSAPRVSGGICTNASAPYASVCNQRVGLATAASPSGPWKRRDAPILDAGPRGEWDDLFTTNPTPFVFSNGSVLLVYKARSWENEGVMSTGVAFAENWAGPYVRRTPGAPIQFEGAGGCEDAGIYRSEAMGVFRMVLHCGCAYQSLWSLNGIHWNATAPKVEWCEVNATDGSSFKLKRRERPKWVIDTQGRPTHLLTGVLPLEATDPVHGTSTFTMAAQILA